MFKLLSLISIRLLLTYIFLIHLKIDVKWKTFLFTVFALLEPLVQNTNFEQYLSRQIGHLLATWMFFIWIFKTNAIKERTHLISLFLVHTYRTIGLLTYLLRNTQFLKNYEINHDLLSYFPDNVGIYVFIILVSASLSLHNNTLFILLVIGSALNRTYEFVYEPMIPRIKT